MPVTRVRAAAIAALFLVVSASPASAGSRIPVNSTDDAASPAANRIAAVTNIVIATNARLTRVAAAFAPNPCADVTEPTTFCDAVIGVFFAYSALGQSVADACAGSPLDGPGDAVITDADAYATDMSAAGIVNQLASIATVLGNADDRLGGILIPSPGPPDSPEAAVLSALSVAIFDGGSAAAGWLGGIFDYPPNPCADLGS